MSDTPLPPCGLYVTTGPIGAVPAGRLVYFHNHGDPGAGVYLPSGWRQNRAIFDPRGTTLPSEEDATSLAPLAPEGLYVVERELYCCAKRCVRYAPGMLVQLGYQASGQALLFVPHWVDGTFELPERGNAVDREIVASLRRLTVPEERTPAHPTTPEILH